MRLCLRGHPLPLSASASSERGKFSAITPSCDLLPVFAKGVCSASPVRWGPLLGTPCDSLLCTLCNPQARMCGGPSRAWDT